MRTINDKYKCNYRGRSQTFVIKQERQTELHLNWDSFKYRNYDYAIGRFMSVDPLAEKYPYNGMYNFSENRVIDGRELEGLEVSLTNGNDTISGPLSESTINDHLNNGYYYTDESLTSGLSELDGEASMFIQLDEVVIDASESENSGELEEMTQKAGPDPGDISFSLSLASTYYMNINGEVRGASGKYYTFLGRKGFNQYTGTKTSMLRKYRIGKGLGLISLGFGLYNYNHIYNEYYPNGQRTTLGNDIAYRIEQSSNTIETFAPAPISFAWYFGHDILGKRVVGQWNWYNETFLPWARAKIQSTSWGKKLYE